MQATQTIRIKRGLDLPLAGVPEARCDDAAGVRNVALLGRDYHGLKPTLEVAEGDRVKLGQTLFVDKGNPRVGYTSPGAGTVVAINRGRRRRLESVVVALEGDAEETFERYQREELDALDPERVVANLIRSGLWTALRTRPFSKPPDPETRPSAIFVTAIDTNPLAPDPLPVAHAHAGDFGAGLSVLSRLTDGPLYLCAAEGAELPAAGQGGARLVRFRGPHPAGLVGTHIHFLHPVGPTRSVWHVGLQDVIAIGKLFLSGRLWVERIVSLGGPLARRPRQLRTRLGASIADLIRDERRPGACRPISGSVFNGRRAVGPVAYLGRYHQQVTLLPEGSPRQFLAFMAPGFGRYSAVKAYASGLMRGRRFALSSSLNGSPRAMVPIGNFEQVMPLDILPAPLLKSLIVRDTETAKALGCLELDEEDLALCAFVCPSKYDYCEYLRETLKLIERDG